MGPVVMARDFKAVDPDTNAVGRYAHVVHQGRQDPELAVIAWQDLLDSRSTFTVIKPVSYAPPTEGKPFRIAVGERDLFVYWGEEIHRQSHDDLLKQLDVFRTLRIARRRFRAIIPWHACPVRLRG